MLRYIYYNSIIKNIMTVNDGNLVLDDDGSFSATPSWQCSDLVMDDDGSFSATATESTSNSHQESRQVGPRPRGLTLLSEKGKSLSRCVKVAIGKAKKLRMLHQNGGKKHHNALLKEQNNLL
jgi:hypothetical protein